MTERHVFMCILCVQMCINVDVGRLGKEKWERYLCSSNSNIFLCLYPSSRKSALFCVSVAVQGRGVGRGGGGVGEVCLTSSSSPFPALSVGFTIFGEIFCVCDWF